MKRTLLVFAGLFLAASCGKTEAAFLDYTIGIRAGDPSPSISYAGGINPLVGSDLALLSLNGNPLATGSLNFTTGNFISSDANRWTFGPGGSLTIAGPDPFAATFVGNTEVIAVGNGDFKVIASAFVGGPSGYDGGLSILFTATPPPGQAFVADTLLSGNLGINVPEPSSVALMGLGGLAFLIAKRRNRKS